ncbi:MAG: DUF3866 family protein [Bacillota bacterium]|nr:DUF3866 family protein [Bacillota bacterium]
MIQSKRGIIVEELFCREGIRAFSVVVNGKKEKCIVYPELVGEIHPGDEVLMNTTAVSLSLGTGGYHYVISRIDPEEKEFQPEGHIMKLRYMPMQLKVLSVEEEDSPYHETMLQADSLGGCPVLVGTLHSMLAPLCLALSRAGCKKIAYVMTDGAALPIAFSRTVDWLKKEHLLVGTVTCGHAFGGDLEAVNVYSAMLAARHVLKADVIIVTMGPGIVGTGTRWGFTGVEQGEILNAVDALEGIPMAVPRLSFADARERHRGISHHSLTVLKRICRVPSYVTLPYMDEEKTSYVLHQLETQSIFERMHICMDQGDFILNLLRECPLKITTMGRSAEEDPEFFMALGASVSTAVHLLKGERPMELKRG